MGKVKLYIEDAGEGEKALIIEAGKDTKLRDLVYTMSAIGSCITGEDIVDYHNRMCIKSGLPFGINK